MADGWQLNLNPPGWDAVSWSDFVHREHMLRWFRESLWRDGLTWEIVEYDQGESRVTTWKCPDDEWCWLCFETRGEVLELVQASFPEADHAWSVRLSVAVVRAICMYQLVVET
ncbi:MAG: hypothetical protein K8T89_00185 [Planctomycetes bacterium]|nr:hypothetical protein [Planctomycetota bacterium]